MSTPSLRRIESSQWDDVLEQFDDASLFQTRAYGETRFGEASLEYWVLEAGGRAMAAAQVRVVGLPGLGQVMAFVTHGPLWRPAGEKRDPQRLRSVLTELCAVYVDQRRMLFRCRLNEFSRDGSTEIDQLLGECGLTLQPAEPGRESLVLDLRPELPELRKSLKKKWRESLSRAERREMEVEEGCSDALFDKFGQVYSEMQTRKGFTELVDVEEFRRMQLKLPERQKLRILVCRVSGETVSALVWSGFGDTGTVHFSGTRGSGLKLRSSYLLRWRALESMKAAGLKQLDQGGVDQKLNPGGYSFKSGFGGDLVREIATHDACKRRWVSAAISLLSFARSRYRQLVR